jgi:hypothetical protein
MNAHNTSSGGRSSIVARMLGGYRETQLLYVVAKLQIADRLASGPMSAQELAVASGANPSALYRVMRALAGLGVFHEGSNGQFELTEASQSLRSDTAGSLHALAASYGEPWWWQSWAKTLECVQRGSTAFELLDGRGIFDFLREHPDAATVFNANMAAMTMVSAGAIVSAVDWSGARGVIDVGGGRGALLSEALRRHSSLNGVLFDQQTVVEGAEELLGEFVHTGRCRIVAGDIFTSVPQGEDIYILKEVLHDWDDSRCLGILRNCRAAMPATGRLLIIERVIGPPNEPTEGKMIDIVMMVMAGGRERTLEEYRELLKRAGLLLRNTYPTDVGLDVIEAGPCDLLAAQVPKST